jgi:hypothetical protein
MDTVARIAIRWGLEPPSATDPSADWIYAPDGSRKRLSHQERSALLREKNRGEADLDPCWNPHGVRRYAAAVTDRSECLAGILALAESFTPGHRDGIGRNLEAVSNAAEKLVGSLLR